jgi:hypothetical protein
MIQETHTWTGTAAGATEAAGRVFFLRTEASLPRLRAASRAEAHFCVPSEDPGVSVAWWDWLERGLLQRFQALQLFMERIASGRSLPLSIDLLTKQNFRQKLRRLAPALCLAPGLRGRSSNTSVAAQWTWFGATDLLLLPDGGVNILDQDFCEPSGLEQLPGLWAEPRERACSRIRAALFPRGLDRSGESPLLFEPMHPAADDAANDFLARCLQAERVHKGQLQASSSGLFRIRNGQQERVRCLVRRVDDELLDPNFFRPDSLVGLPGLVRCWTAGETRLLHAPGSSLLGLRAVIRQVPQMIREFLGEEPLLETAKVLECHRSEDLDQIRRNPHSFLFRRCDPRDSVRPVCGRTAGAAELEGVLSRIQQDPSGWCARPLRQSEEDGRSARFFAAWTDQFRLLRAGLSRRGQADGGCSRVIPGDATRGSLELFQ